MLAIAALTSGFALASANAEALPTGTPQPPLAQGWLDAHQPLTTTTWVRHYLLENQRVALEEGAITLALEPFKRPWVAGLTEVGWFERGRYGARLSRARWALNWNDAACDSTSDPFERSVDPDRSSDIATYDSRWSELAILAIDNTGARWSFSKPAPIRLSDPTLGLVLAPEPAALGIQPTRHCPAYKNPASVTLIRTDGEHDRFRLLECDGSVSADSLDRLSTLLRPVGVARPELPLPSEPNASDTSEWVDGVKLVHPRLFWVLQRVAQAFPWRAITIVSGYRRESHGYHPRGRAADISVHGIDNTVLFEFCRTLNDVGCGYYPNNKFVHVDVREFGSKHPSWVDIAEPGQPSHYVDQWPGIGPLSRAGGVTH